MCGIAGYVDWSTRVPDTDTISAMTRTLQPRGPDASAVWTDTHVALGHTRLAVIDPAGGKQPMLAYRNSAPLVLTYGGEIYNHAELRRQLSALGHEFTTRSDTEVVLQAYLRWGPRCVEEFNGMFAFAIWDSSEQSLLLARDRVGIKPLYYAQLPNGLVFGSELKAVLAHPAVDAVVDANGLAELTALVPMTSPGCAVLRNVNELVPASTALIDRGGMSIHRYWELKERRHEDDLATTVERIRDLLADSIKGQVVADVPLCTLNSGGVDSAAMTAIVAREISDSTHNLLTFDIDHAMEGADVVAHSASALHVERDNAYALLIAKHVGSQHDTLIVSTEDLLNAHDATLEAMDLPSYSTLNASLGLLFHRIRRDATVALSGEGADELFHGYRWYHQPADYAQDNFPWHRTYRPIVDLMSKTAVDHIKPMEYSAARYRETLEKLPPGGESTNDRRLREVAKLTNDYYLPFLLRRADRTSMAAGVEVRVPYLDHRLVEYTWNIPPSMKQVGGIEKGVLRTAIADLLPNEIAWRRKSGYPASITMSYHRALWQRAREVLTDPGSAVRNIVDAAAVTAFLDRHDGDLSDWTPTQHVSYLLELDAWFARYHVHIA
ncbi:asparagine synthase (glutamine-hydrolyzing) [Nocardia sp. GCM10030253]|uniref:asparagine synthase (glutamine-hydrolyzing) n=1 Tax=Nocardia sp. GCM10030253 TaxID=3273404 RepID=UPI0036389C44